MNFIFLRAMVMKLWIGGGYTSGLEEKEDSFADINDIFGDK